MVGLDVKKCQTHDDRVAVAACAVCGEPLCNECVRAAGGRYYCAAHLPAENEVAPRAVKRARMGALLAVVAILAVTWGILYALGPAAEEAARLSAHEVSGVRLDEIADGLDNFRRDVGRYPTQEEGLESLLAAPAQDKRRWLGPYIPAAYVKDGSVVDAFGRPIRYRVEAEGHFVVGTGLDGKSGSADDIRVRLEGRVEKEPLLPGVKGLALPAAPR